MTVKLIKDMTNEQIAYLAGIMDGEGTISVSRTRDKTMKRKASFRPYITVVNTNIELIHWMHEITGLGAISKLYVSKNKKHKSYKRWTVWTRQSEQLIKSMLPYLRVKKEQALLTLELLSIQKPVPRLSDEEWSKQVVIADKLTKLNKRGKNE